MPANMKVTALTLKYYDTGSITLKQDQLQSFPSKSIRAADGTAAEFPPSSFRQGAIPGKFMK
jgi:hypothetical protein